MRRLLDTMTARTVLVLLAGLGIFHIASLLFYQHGLDRELAGQDRTHLVERLVAIRHALLPAPADKREALAHQMSGGPVDAHWGHDSLAVATNDDVAPALRADLLARDPTLLKDGLVVGLGPTLPDRAADPHVAVVSMGLGDGSWANVSVIRFAHLHGSLANVVLSTTLMAIGVIALSFLLVRWITGPLQRLAGAARNFQGAETPIQLIEAHGPREVRDAAEAFNDMQQRIRTLIQERTLALAAISHDLKTPLTRLRFQIEDLDDEQLRQRIASDIAEMDEMIDATLAFLRGEHSPEELRKMELRALVESIGDDFCDRGLNVTIAGSGRGVVEGRRVDLKRALSNLIYNAVKYGGAARVSVNDMPNTVAVTIDDDGPGIPEDKIEAVLAPFFRLETSRSRETGGVGLGLTVADRIVAAHAGSLTLANLQPKGLRVTVILPKDTEQALGS